MSETLIVTYQGENRILEVDDKDVLVFPHGLVGFEELHRFVLLEDPDEAPIAVLQCLDDTSISFLVTDPQCVCAGYNPALPEPVLEDLGLDTVQHRRMLATLSARGEPTIITADLLGPIVVNVHSRMARQVVLQNSPYSTQHPVLVAEGGPLISTS